MQYQIIFRLEDREKKLELDTSLMKAYRLAKKFLKKYNFDEIIINRKRNGEWKIYLTISYLEWARKKFEANLV